MPRWVDRPTPPQMVEAWRAAGLPPPRSFALMSKGRDELHAILSRDNIAAPRDVPDERWHLSVSGDGRVPSWDEIAAACHALRPGVTFVVGVPPRSYWINVNENVLHAYETRDANLEAQWLAEGRGVGDKPT